MENFDDEEDGEDVDIDLGDLQIAETDPRLNESLRVAPPGRWNRYLLLFRARPSGASYDSFSTLLKTGVRTDVKSLKFLATHLSKVSEQYLLKRAALADTFPFPGFLDTRFQKKKPLKATEKEEVREWLLLLLTEVIIPTKVVVFGKEAAEIVSELFLGGVPIKLNSSARYTIVGISFAFASHPSVASFCPSQYGMEYNEALENVIDDDFA